MASTVASTALSQPAAFEAALRCSSSRSIITTPPKIFFANSHHKKCLLAATLLCKASLDQQISEVSEGSSSGTVVSTSRRCMFNLLAASVAAGVMAKAANAAPTSIKVAGPPPLSGGLPGTENADEARDLDLPLKNRFFIQSLTPAEAVSRVKDSVGDIVGVKDLIAKKAWPYVQNDLRNKASYLRYDLNTIISSKSKEEKKSLKALTSKLFETIDKLDYAARSKSLPEAEKYYAETVSALNTVISKIA